MEQPVPHGRASAVDVAATIDRPDEPIDAKALRATDRFWQGQRTSYHGAGLGLAIAKGVVDAHGGRIWVTSPSGVGTTVHTAFPSASVR